MKILKSTKTLIAASILGLVMAVSSVAYSQPPGIDASADIVEATESAADAPENGPHETTTEPKTGESAQAEPDSAELEPSGEVNPAEDDPIGTGGGILDAFKGGHWLVAIGGILMFVIWFLRAFVFGRVAWFKTKPGGFTLALGTSIILGICAAVFGGAELGAGLIGSIIVAKYAAAGGWGHVKDVFDL